MEVALLILFNHKFERNLPRLREIYSGRFKNLHFIMPFYTGTDEDVIGVYEHSFHFQGYIAQALRHIKKLGIDHYMVIADDLMLNPAINQHNYTTYFKLADGEGFVPEVFLLHDDLTPKRLMQQVSQWTWNRSAVKIDITQGGIEIETELPTADVANQLLKTHGFNFEPVLSKKALQLNYPDWNVRNVNDLKAYALSCLNSFIVNSKFSFSKRRTIKYPVVGSYSDIIIIPGSSINLFGHYAGIMSALKLFVEMAIPTALLLSVQKVTQEKNLEYKGVTYWGAAATTKFEEDYNNNLNILFEHFPKNALYIHPVKLSKWKYQ